MTEEQILRKLRDAKKEGKSNEAISRLTGFSSWTIARWLNGKCKMSQAAIQSVCWKKL